MLKLDLDYTKWTEIDYTKWIIDRIQRLEERAKINSNWMPTHRNIWQGSFDVINSLQDEVDAVEMPKTKMKFAEENGYIKSEIKKIRNYNEVIWSVTDLGEKLILM